MLDGERRDDLRQPLHCPCKLYVPQSGRYLAGSTFNLSRGGALLQLDQPARLEPGDHLYLGIAMKRRQALLAADEMTGVKVLRVVPAGKGGFALAVQFLDQRLDTAVGFRRRAA